MEQTKKRATLYAIALFILLIVVFIVTIIQDKKKVLEEKTSAHRALLRNSFDLAMSDTQKGLNELAYKLASNRDIVDAFAAGDRKKLYTLSQPIFIEAKKRGDVDTSGFISADGNHFLRIQTPTKYGDNILRKRPVLAYAIKSKKSVTTLDVTIHEVSVVTIVPVYKDKKFIGVIQTVAHINRVQKRLDAHSGIKSAIAFDTKRLKNLLPDRNTTDYQNFSLVSTNDELFNHLPAHFRFDQSNVYTINAHDYVIASRSLTNYNNDVIAMMMCAFEITDDVNAYYREIRNLLIFSLILLVVVTLILHYGFSILLRRIEKDAQTTQLLNQKLTHQLHTDHLTSLPNRNALIRDIHSNHYFALILINIDNFKEINDFYGHAVGDETLLVFAHAIESVIQPFPMRLYKMPSDEFAIIVTEPLETNILESYRLHIITTLQSQNYNLYGINIYITLTMGMDIYSNRNNQISNLLTNADMALKSAKKRHLSYMLYDETMLIKQEYHNNILWSKRVKEAIEENRLTLCFQPIFDTYTGDIIEYEALIRMIDEEGNIISPMSFLPAAKQSRLYPLISQYVINEVFRMLETTSYRISINLSVDDIFDRATRELLMERLKNTIHSERIIFELLESEGIENYSEVSTFIAEVKQYGCQIAIDDFGTGYSNFAHILRLDVDILKIDGSLIRNLDTDSNVQTILIAVAEFSKRLGLKTVAEFVHSESIYNQCKLLGIDYLQGYYLGEPKPLS